MENDKLQQILLTKKHLAQIKEKLDKLVDAFAENTSLLSKAAAFWGKLPWWQKTIAGSIIIIPLFVISIITHIMVLLALSLFISITYAATSLLLDNHHKQSANDKDSLKKGILSLANMLGTVIESLEQLRLELANEITKFQQENEHLKTLVSQLGEQVEALTREVTQLVDIEQQLHVTQEELKKTSAAFADSVQSYTELLDKNKVDLEQAINDYEACQVQLSAKIIELEDIKIKMGLELDQAKKVSLTLQGTVDTLTNTVIPDEGQRLVFQERLQEFLANKEKSFDQIVDRICEAEHKLLLVQEELRLNNERHGGLLNRADDQIKRLEQTFTIPIIPSATLKKIGLFAFNELDKHDPIFKEKPCLN